MRTQRAVLLVGFYLLVALFFLRASVFANQTLLDVGLALCIGVVVTLACVADSLILDRPMPHAAKWVMVFVWPVASPIYLLWSRGRRGVVLLVIHAAIFAALWIGTPLFTFGVMGIERFGLVSSSRAIIQQAHTVPAPSGAAR